jgi:TatD DNase family protein
MLLETDSPYLTPVPKRGQRNEPANINYVALEIAKLKVVEYDKVCQQTSLNAEKLFSLE